MKWIQNWFKKTTAKRKIVSILAIVLLCAIGIYVANKIYYATLSPLEKWIVDYEDFLHERNNKICKRIETPSGATLLFVTNEKSFSKTIRVVWDTQNGQIQNISFDSSSTSQDAFSKIFYEEDGYSCESFMKKIMTPIGTDVVIQITPNIPYYVKIPPYSETKWYGIVPYDTTGSKIVKLYNTPEERENDMQATYPIWLLTLSYDDIPEDYELHYGDYVLTYEDIKNGTWEP